MGGLKSSSLRFCFRLHFFLIMYNLRRVNLFLFPNFTKNWSFSCLA